MMVKINNPVGKYYGVIDKGGSYEQGSPVAALAILEDTPTEPGEYEAVIIEPKNYTWGYSTSIFNVKFKPTLEGYFTKNLTTENGFEKMEGRAYEDTFNFESDTDEKIIAWYK